MKDGEADTFALTDEQIFKEVQARFQIAEEAESEDRKLAVEDLKFANGDQWPEDISRVRQVDNRPEITVNFVDTFVRRIVNNLKQQRPRGKCHPVGDGADKEKAEVMNGLGRHIEYLSNASVAYDMGGESAVRMGWGYWRVIADYIDPKSDDQELYIRPIRNAFTVYMDPDAKMPDASDAQWCIISETMKRTQYKLKYPRAENCDFVQTGVGDQDGDWDNREDIRLAEYYRLVEHPEVLCRMSDGSYLYESELPSPESMEAAKFTVVSKRDSCSKKLQWFRINGTKVVDKRELPGEYIPVVRCEGDVLDINGQVHRKGMVRNLIGPQRMFNYGETAKVERLGLTTKASWIMAEGQDEGHPEWNDANTKSYSRLVYKPVSDPASGAPLPPPQRTPPAAVEAGFAEFTQSMQSNLMAVAGMPHEPDADARGQVVSGKAIQRRQGLSDISHFQYYDNQTSAIAHTWRILLGWIPYYYDTHRMQRIIGEDGTPAMQEINQPQIDPTTGAILSIKNDLTVGRYDVVMDTGPGYQTKREEGSDAMLGLLGTPLGEVITKVGPDLVVRNMDFAGADDLADRLVATTPEGMQKAIAGLPKQAQAIVGTLQQQLQQAGQEIQHLQLELKYKTSTELGWMHVEREKSHLNAETKVHDTNVRSVTARDVAEIQAGASLLNTHAEAEHEKEAAKLMIKSAEKASNKPN